MVLVILFMVSKACLAFKVKKSFSLKICSYQYLALSGSNVEVESLVIGNTTRTMDDIIKLMQKKKEETETEKEKDESEKKKEEEGEKKREEEGKKKKMGEEKFAFMFSSMKKNQRKHVSNAFKKVFPKVPLLGLVLERPIGFKYPQKTDSTKNQLKIYSIPTSVFLFVTVTYPKP